MANIFYEDKDFVLVNGNGDFIISCCSNNQDMINLAFDIQKNTDCHLIYSNKKSSLNPSEEVNGKYQLILSAFITKYKLKHLWDFNYSSYENDVCEIDINTSFLTNVNGSLKSTHFVRNFLKRKFDKTEIDMNSKSNCMVDDVHSITGIDCLDFNISNLCLVQNKNLISKSFSDLICFLNGYDKNRDCVSNYQDGLRLINIKFENFGFEINFKIDCDENSMKIFKYFLEEFFRDFGSGDYNINSDDTLGDIDILVKCSSTDTNSIALVDLCLDKIDKFYELIQQLPLIKQMKYSVFNHSIYESLYNKSVSEFNKEKVFK